MPNSGDTCWMGVSLSKDLSSAGFGGWETVFDVDSSEAGVCGVEGASRGVDSTRTIISLSQSPARHSSASGTVCISH